MSQAVTLSWDFNTETNVIGYRVYIGSFSRIYDSSIDVGNINSVVLPTKLDTTYYAVTAYDSLGLESDYSEEVFYPPPIINTNVPPLPTLPITVDDQYMTTQNVTLTVLGNRSVMLNDSNVVNVALLTLPQHGSMAFFQDGTFQYTPSKDFLGLDSCQYTGYSTSVNSSVANILINVMPSSLPPINIPDAPIGLEVIKIDKLTN